jgi:hypothetical protein
MTAWLCRADLRRLRAPPRLRQSCSVAIVNLAHYIAPPCDFQEGTLQAQRHKPPPRLSTHTGRLFFTFPKPVKDGTEADTCAARRLGLLLPGGKCPLPQGLQLYHSLARKPKIICRWVLENFADVGLQPVVLRQRGGAEPAEQRGILPQAL